MSIKDISNKKSLIREGFIWVNQF